MKLYILYRYHKDYKIQKDANNREFWKDFTNGFKLDTHGTIVSCIPEHTIVVRIYCIIIFLRFVIIYKLMIVKHNNKNVS